MLNRRQVPAIEMKPPSTSRRVTVENIAEYAGVSIGAVSSVLNNRHLERRISAETVMRIREAAAKLGYLPNISARRLRSRASSRNSIVLALVTSFEAPIPLVNHFILAVRSAAAQLKGPLADGSFSVMVEMFSAGRLRDMPGILTGDHFNAAIILNTTAEDDHFLNRSHLPYPVVLVNRSVPGYAAVFEEGSAGARAATILADARRVKLGVLHGTPLTQITQTRVDSFMREASARLGKQAEEIITDKLSERGAYEAMKAFLERGGEVDGLYAVSDALALGAYQAIKERKLRIPDDIAVLGVGDYEIAPYFDPPLSAVGVSHRDMAERASSLLLSQLVQTATPRLQIALPVEEMLRASSGHR